MIGIGLVSLLIAEVADFQEFRIVAIMCGVLLALALLLMLAPVKVSGRLELQPTHTVAGEAGHGVVHATCRWPWRLNRPLVVVPVDPQLHGPAGPVIEFRAPVLRRSVEQPIAFEVPAQARGVRRLGPAGIRRTDPLGCFSRRTSWTSSAELWVRPAVAHVASLGQGWIRDLEGVPSDVISMSDLSFHALREYVRGDDLRHVHWRSSARTGQLHVRQYHDTRRSHVVVIVDDRSDRYPAEADYELALSAAASVVVRAALDESDLTFASGAELMFATATEVLDALCLAERGATDLVDLARLTAARAHDASQVIVVCGEGTAADDLAGARAAFSSDVRFLGIRIAPGSGREAEDLIRVAALADLPGALAALVDEAQS